MSTNELQHLEQSIINAVSKFDIMIARYAEIIQHQQFVTNETVTIENISDGTNAVIDLSHQTNQQTLFNAGLIVVPTGVTELTVQLGRYTFVIDNPPTIINLFPIQYVLGQGDTIKISWTPIGTHAAYFALYGHKTGGNFAL